MNDALAFTRRMKVAQPAQGQRDLVASDTQRGFSALIGSIFGYSAAKTADVGTSALNQLFAKQGFNDEQLMRMLLTPEGANFLRQGALTGSSAKTLEALTNVPTALQEGSTGFSALSRLVSPQQQPTVEQNAIEQPQATEDQFQMPPDLQQETEQPIQDQQFQMPPDLVQQPSANDLTSEDQNQILNFLGASPKPSRMSGINPQLQMR